MIIDINLWRSQIGQYYGCYKRISFKNKNYNQNYSDFSLIAFLSITCLLLMASLHFQFFINAFHNPNISINYLLSSTTLNFYLYYFFIANLLLLCGDIESNPGPNKVQNLSICHWNMNSIPSHNFQKIFFSPSF